MVEGQWQCWMQRAARGWRARSDHRFIEQKGRGLSVARPSTRVASIPLAATAPLFVVAIHASSCRLAVLLKIYTRIIVLSCPVSSLTPRPKGNQPASRMKPPPPLCFIPSYGRFAPQQQSSKQHGTALPTFFVRRNLKAHTHTHTTNAQRNLPTYPLPTALKRPRSTPTYPPVHPIQGCKRPRLTPCRHAD